MTVETPDPETERENLAQKVFLLEKWQAEAVKTISKLEGERDEAVAEVKAARAEIARLGAVVDEVASQAVRDEREIADKLKRAEFDLDHYKAEVAGLVKATDFQRDRANRLHRMFVKALDAI
jgi:uncharacterized coiled-coil DUF342 family protein